MCHLTATSDNSGNGVARLPSGRKAVTLRCAVGKIGALLIDSTAPYVGTSTVFRVLKNEILNKI